MQTLTLHRFHNDNNDSHHRDCGHEDANSLLLVVLATGAALLLGYFLGRTADSRNRQPALDRGEPSPEPIEISIPIL